MGDEVNQKNDIALLEKPKEIYPNAENVLDFSMLLQLEIAIREIEKRLDLMDLEFRAHGVDKDDTIKFIQDIQASHATRKGTTINNIMINNVQFKSMSFIFEIKDILSVLKDKVKNCKLLING
jgi:hypothetical protein